MPPPPLEEEMKRESRSTLLSEAQSRFPPVHPSSPEHLVRSQEYRNPAEGLCGIQTQCRTSHSAAADVGERPSRSHAPTRPPPYRSWGICQRVPPRSGAPLVHRSDRLRT